MSAIHPDDPLFDAIGALPVVRPDAAHAERVRARSRAVLQQPARPFGVSLEPAAVGTICAIYAWQVVKIATKIPLP